MPKRRLRVIAWLVGIVAILGLLLYWSLRPNPKEVLLDNAISRAKAELGSFTQELQKPKPGEGFAIKASFNTPIGPEYLWVRNPVFANNKFTGKLDQEPHFYKTAHKGDTVTVKQEDVVDWLIKDGPEMRGMYTERVLNQ